MDVIDGAKPFGTEEVDDEAYCGKKPLKSVAERLLEIGRTATYFQTPDRVAYADIAISGNRHTYAVRSRAFRMWLAGDVFQYRGERDRLTDDARYALNLRSNRSVRAGFGN